MQRIVPARHFNSITFKNHTVIKSSNSEFMKGERFWYENIPDEVGDLFPTLIESSEDSITIEKISGVNLSYLLTNGLVTFSMLDELLSSLERIHQCIPKHKIGNIYANYADKLRIIY